MEALLVAAGQNLKRWLARVGWGRDDSAFRQVFTSQFMPEGSRELWDQFNELQRNTTSAQNAAQHLEASSSIDVAPTVALTKPCTGLPATAGSDSSDSTLVPTLFVAVTVHVYVLPAVAPVTASSRYPLTRKPRRDVPNPDASAGSPPSSEVQLAS